MSFKQPDEKSGLKKVVIKIGGSLIAPFGNIDKNFISKIVKEISEVEKLGYKTVLVSSGAIAFGLNRLGYKDKPQDKYTLMSISSIGQILLMDSYIEEFNKYNKLCAQILLTWEDFDNRKRFLNLKSTIEKLLNFGIIPIINENDAISFDEIRFGDNDRLSSLVANSISADILIILSDVEGLMDKENRLINIVSSIDSKILSLVREKKSSLTSGGMKTKLEAAKIAINSGITTVLASGYIENVILRILNNENIGTKFLAQKNIDKAKKRWIAFSKRAKGKIYIDEGAKDAIINKNKSLLCAGIIKIEGEFQKKDSVCILDKEGNILGCGLVNYSSVELKEFKTKKFEKELINRDNFVVLKQ